MQVESGQQQSHKIRQKKNATKEDLRYCEPEAPWQLTTSAAKKGLPVKKDLPSRRDHGDTFQLAKKPRKLQSAKTHISARGVGGQQTWKKS
jgi:hypothetical protein